MRPTYTARRFARALSCLLLWGAAGSVHSPPVTAQDVEEILSYDVTIDIAGDGNMIVSEDIVVRALGREIRRGVYRDFPTSFPRESGFGRIEAPFAMRFVRKDGEFEPWELSNIGSTFGRGGVRIRIGDPNVVLEPGVYSYHIEYTTRRWIYFDDDHDELYWNVTGNGWGFPIRSASATIVIAGLTQAPEMDAWTGPEGSRAQDATTTWDESSGTAVFRTTTGLEPEEGLTVSVRFPKGLVGAPSPEEEARYFALDWGGYIDAGYIVALIFALYLFMWVRVGRDPEKGPIMTRYAPPDGFSPASLGYLQDRGFDHRHFAAAIVSLAVKGVVRIEQDRKKWSLHKTGEAADLTSEEQQVYFELLHDEESIELKQGEHKRLRKAVKGMKATLSGRLEKEYFLNNRLWFAAGLAVSLIGFGALAFRWRFGIEPAAGFLGLWLAMWTGGVATMLTRAVKDIAHARRGGGAGYWAAGLGMGCFSIPFVAAELVVGYMFVGMVPTHVVIAAVAIGATNVLFYHLLERPTLRGRGVLNHVDGFSLFLAATDQDRLDRAMVPDRTPELFERFLPHAIALGLENKWARAFQWVLDPKGEMGSPQTFAWYDGGTAAMDATSFSSSLGASLSSTLSSSSSPPSSGGSGGGGSSGGGGGGGGGGGW